MADDDDDDDDEDDDADRDVHEAWVDIDRARAVHPIDHAAIQSTEPLRSLVLSRLANLADDRTTTDPHRDLFTACARLGGMLADLGASPTLASGAIDSATQALERVGRRPKALDNALVHAARASVVEGFSSAIRDAERAASSSAWEYPACVVPIGSDAVTIACGYPSDDPEAIALWAARLATKLVKAKTKRAVLSGSPLAMKEVESALSFVGIATGDTPPPPPIEPPPEPPTKKKSWLPWRR